MFQPKFEPSASKHVSDPLPLEPSFICLFKYCLQHVELPLMLSPQQFILRHNLFSFLALRDQVSHPYTSRGTSITKFLYNPCKINAVMFVMLEISAEDFREERLVVQGISQA